MTKSQVRQSHRKNHLKLVSYLVLGLLCLSVFSPLASVKASQELYFSYPQNVQRGETFYIVINLPSQQTIETVQLFFNYDPSVFEYDPTGSYLIKSGLEFNDGHNIFADQKNGKEASLALIHWMQDIKTDANGTVAQLAFKARQDADLASSVISMVYSANNVAPFVSTTEQGKIVEAEGFNMKLDLVAAEIPEPQPAPIPPSTNQAPTGDGQAAGTSGSGNSTSGEVGLPQANLTQPQASKTEPAPSQSAAATTTVKVKVEHKSPLLDNQDRELFVPSMSPPQSQIPPEFSLQKMTLHKLEIPALHSAKTAQTFYYLLRDNQASFYTYKAETDRFTPVDIDKYLIRDKKHEQKSFDPLKAEQESGPHNLIVVIILVTLVIACLAVILNVAIRQFRR